MLHVCCVGVSCDACGKSSFSGRRYKCLTCYDFDLCAECYESVDVGSSRHSSAHPMQCILTRVESGKGLNTARSETNRN